MMKLIKEYIIKIFVLIIVLTILMEVCILFLLIIRSSRIFNVTYNQTIEQSEIKTIKLTEKFKNYINNLFMKYSTDLKLICKHALLLNGKKEYISSDVINKKSKIFNNSNKLKEIIPANIEDLLTRNYMRNIYNKSSKSFIYIDKYEEKFLNIADQNIILNALFSNSSELNAISYYGPIRNETEQITSIKFIISILKTIYIKRYISKRNNMDYIRFIILNKDEIFIYPPDSYKNTYLYYFEKSYPYPYSDCSYNSSDKSKQFPLCAYNMIINNSVTKEDNYVFVVYEHIYYEKAFNAVCLKIPFIKNNPNQAILCLEIEFSSLFNTFKFNKLEKFEFGTFLLEYSGIIPIIYSRKEIITDFKNTFNDTVSDKFLIDENHFPAYSFFHFLYYNITKIAKLHPELNVNFKEIEEEYNVIQNQIISEIEKYNNNNNSDEYIKFNFTKSICRKKLLANSYECFKDIFEMIIIPYYVNLNKLNEDFIEIQNEFGKGNLNMFIFSIISTNPYNNNQIIYTISRIK